MDVVIHKTYGMSDFLNEVFGNFISYFGLFSWRSSPPNDIRLDGQTIIITGGNKGIGRDVAKDVASRGARVIIACRDTTAGQEVVREIKQQNPSASVSVKQVDMTSLKSIKAFSDAILKEEPRIDVLVNNAGIMMGKKQTAPETGWELMMMVNHFGLVFLTMNLLSRMKESSPDPRVLSVSSMAHSGVTGIGWHDLSFTNTKYDFFDVYCQSKQAVILFSRELAKRNPWLRVYAVDPGTSVTGLFDPSGLPDFIKRSLRSSFSAPFFRSVKSSADSLVHAILHPKEEYDPNNNYLYDGKVKVPAPAARNAENQKKCWEETARLLSLESLMN